ncbi:olfactory receptor 6N1-like [Melanotaenia boesemani]|uniref:olfactory receptor 6N1-like n=1 Tax=Melanotaenia boesemani TaxID=1250792 RepID=UPI001C03A433|nr:olfactory receptor 6N1-like [Melanotaenia boesemani]
MENITNPPYFNLTMFFNIGYYCYPTFVLCFLVYAFIISSNLFIIVVIAQEKSLHEPMYILIMCLCLNSLYGSAGFFLRFLRDLLSGTHLISRSGCFTQIYVIYTYASYELTILSIMAYDRYVAVCQPLHYHSKMNPRMISKLLALAWIYPAFTTAACIYLSSRLPLCGNRIPKVFCANWPVVKLSCISTELNNLVGMLFTTTTVFLSLAFVLYTYLRIFFVCRRHSSEFKRKVIQNCLPHIVTFITYSITGFCDIVLSRIDNEKLNPFLAIVLSLEFVVIPPILNPLVYGLKLPEIRKLMLRMLSCLK